MEEPRRKSYSSSYSSHTSSRRNYGRSGYRAVKPQPKLDKVDYKEVVLSQCIVCGVILIIALCINLIDSGFTNSIRNGIKTALSSKTTIGSVTESLDGFTQSYSGIKNSINTIFGRVPDEDTEDTLESVGLNSANPDQASTGEVLAAESYIGNEQPEQAQQATAQEGNIYREIKNEEIKNEENKNETSGQITSPIDDEAAAMEEAKIEEGAVTNNENSNALIVDENFRIDEDILEQMNSMVDFYTMRLGIEKK